MHSVAGMRSRSFAAIRPLLAFGGHPAGTRPLPAAHSGFTLAEIVVALVLLAWGALAVVAASIGAIRVVEAAEAQERATLAARQRVEQLASRRCSSLHDASSVDSSLAMRERWTITPPRNGVRLAIDTVEYTDHGVPRTVVLERLVVC
jgi:Tfp pilus assembly protein PilV